VWSWSVGNLQKWHGDGGYNWVHRGTPVRTRELPHWAEVTQSFEDGQISCQQWNAKNSEEETFHVFLLVYYR
jgi:hypothetical protein